MVDRAGRSVVADVVYEKINPGPAGRLVEVIDYDPVHKCWYEPVNLDDPAVMLNSGLDVAETDPQVSPADGLRRRHAGARDLRAGARATVPVAGHTARCGSTPMRSSARTRTSTKTFRPAVRVLRGRRRRPRTEPARTDGVHRAVPRHHRARNDARRRAPAANALLESDQPRRARLP